MNTLFLIIAGIFVLLMGQRFWPLMLQSIVFRPLTGRTPPRASTGANLPAPLRLGQDIASSGGILAMFGIGLALSWGWAPVFVWIMVGCTMLAGLLKFGLLWSQASTPGNTGLDSLRVLFGNAFASILGVSLIITLLIWSAMLTMLLTALLVRHPEILAVLLCQVLLALTLWRHLPQASGPWLTLVVVGGGLLAAPLVLMLVYQSPDSVTRVGQLASAIGPLPVAALLLGLLVIPAHIAGTRLRACIGSVVAIGAVLVGVILLLALALERPDAGFAAYFRAQDSVSAMPLILVCASFGILPLLGTLDHASPTTATAPDLFGATSEGLIALALLAIWLTASQLAPTLPVHLPDWHVGLEPGRVSGYLLDGITVITDNLAIDPRLRSAAAAAAIAGLGGLALIRILSTLGHQLERLHPALGGAPRAPALAWLTTTALMVLVDRLGYLETGLWLAAGQLALLFGAGVLLAAGFAAMRLKRSPWPGLLPGILLMASFWWACIAQLTISFTAGNWPLLSIQVSIAMAGLLCVALSAGHFSRLLQLRRRAAPAAKATPGQHPESANPE